MDVWRPGVDAGHLPLLLFTLCTEERILTRTWSSMIRLVWLASLLHDPVFICYACFGNYWLLWIRTLVLMLTQRVSYCTIPPASTFSFSFSLGSQPMTCYHPH